MNKKDLNEWYRLKMGLEVCKPLKVLGPKDEHEELIRLNHLIMEEVHKIHNDNMLNK